MTQVETMTPVMASPDRRHDLDALRAFAMLLGIGLHASLSFFQAPWPVQDSRQNEILGLMFVLIHGFRMPLFFIVSGYFTMMLFRKRGLPALLRQRASRILLPCVLGLATIVPLTEWVSNKAITSQATAARPNGGDSLAEAVRTGDAARIESLIAQTDQLDRPEARFGLPPLHWAVLRRDVPLATRLIERGADVNRATRDGNRPLHAAAFMGFDDMSALLLSKQADPNVRNLAGEVPLRSISADWESTRFIAAMLGLTVNDPRELEVGREKVRQLLSPVTLDKTVTDRSSLETLAATRRTSISRWRDAYQDWLRSERWRISIGGRSWHLFHANLFSHLWFLWFLCWLVAGFAILAPLVKNLTGRMNARRWSFGLIPLTILPQLVMGVGPVHFGPDTSTGLLPQPHLLIYYGLFFAFGVFTYIAETQGCAPRDRGWLPLCLAILVAFPLWMLTIGNFTTSVIAQVIYVWAFSLGLLGLFRRYVPGESVWIRYVSDSSYWLYLAHLPLVMALQWLIRDWPASVFVKFMGVNLASLFVLLLSYHWLVRRTVVGTLLNGRRASAARPT